MSKKQSDKKGFFIAGAICVAAVLIAGTVVTNNIRSGIEQIKYEPVIKAPSPTPKVTPATKAASAARTDIPKETKTAKKAVAVENTAREKQEFIMPAEGAVTVKFTGDGLVYSPTFDDWRSHSGIDIEAEADSQVKAVADGKILKVYTDEMMGNTIEIDHGDGLVTRYASLTTTDLVREGDTVKQGDVISGVGSSAAAEKSQNPHLHFEVIYNGEAVDPLSKYKPDILMPSQN